MGERVASCAFYRNRLTLLHRSVSLFGGRAGMWILGTNGHVFPFGAAADHSTTDLPAVDLILAP